MRQPKIEFHGLAAPTDARTVARELMDDLPWPEDAEVRIVFTDIWHCYGSSIYDQKTLDLCTHKPVAVPEFPFVVVSLGRPYRAFWRSTLAHELCHLSDWMLRPHDRQKGRGFLFGSVSRMYLDYPWERRAFLFQIRHFPGELHPTERLAIEVLYDAGFLERDNA